ncbi:hypothetical protein SteCoe_25525 [Stentor coeruleus]|uniref:Protein kinase domain-containing protein n=1 Tax=Stentor coeruleus TaxID=5963 RepID=A0A1R2BF05_9CILI|nr:hypothetical protein SteCoe_25525 [Stentor coeruleus]
MITRKHLNSSEKSITIKSSSMKLRSLVAADETQASNLCDYISLSFLGIGAFGEVLSTMHIPSSSRRALKIIKKTRFNFNELKSSTVFKESIVLSKLNHHKIIRFHEMLEDENNFYIITELCEGGSLKDRLKKSNRFTEKKTLDILKQVLEGVEYLHSQNVVHLDIKLENVLLVDISSDNIKIADFGCSRYIQPGEILKDYCGTLYYLAPDVINENYTEKADIWSCGILALIMLTGNYPFSGKSKDEIKEKIKTITTSQLIEKISHVSLETQNLIREILETDMNKRITAEKARKHCCFNQIN